MSDLEKQEIIARAQELVDEFRAKGGIEEPVRVVEGDRAAFFSHNRTISIDPKSAKEFTPDEFRAVIAHEVGHASNRAEVDAKKRSELMKAYVVMGISLAAGAFASPAVAAPGFAFGIKKLHDLGGGGKLYAAEECRADRFAIEKLGIDPLVMQQAFERDCSMSPDRDKGWFKKQAEINKTYLNEAVKERLGEIQKASHASQGSARESSPKLETSSTGRIIGGSRFSRPPVITRAPEPQITQTRGAARCR